MYFLPRDISRLLNTTDTSDRDRELETAIHDLTPRLAAKRNEYRHFGPFWWWVKPLVASSPAGRRTWLSGGYIERSFTEQIESSAMGSAPLPDDSDRWLAWLGVKYYEYETVDDTPAGFHIVQAGATRVIAYTVHDADAGEQLSLFEEEQEHASRTAFLTDPARYTGSPWLSRAEVYISGDDPFRGAAALRRGIHRAISEEDRSRAWIRLGQLFQEQEHTRKALFCYQNAYHRGGEAWIQGLMGDVWLQEGDPQEALRCYRTALEAMPGNPEYDLGYERARQLVAESDHLSAAYTLEGERLAR